MATVTITIPDPILPALAVFDYVIINTVTGVVSPIATATNSPFDITLSSGSYEIRITYGDYEAGWCFNVTECDCPVYDSAVIESSAFAVNYLLMRFDFSGGFSCPFQITVATPGNEITYIVTTLLDFDSHVGDIYTYKVFIGAATTATFTAKKLGAYGGTTCVSTTVNYHCAAPLITDPHYPMAGYIHIIKDAGQWKIRFRFYSCGDSCHTFNITYRQDYILPGYESLTDIGTATITLDCGDPSPWQHDIILNPTFTFYNAGTDPDPAIDPYMSYFLTVKDCCGVVDPRITKVQHGLFPTEELPFPY